MAAGTKEVWVVDHENFEVFITTAEGIRLPRANDIITSPLLEGFSLSIAELLAE
jgi:Uma2 family endonuclease